MNEPTINAATSTAVTSSAWLADCDRAEKEAYRAYRDAVDEESAAHERRMRAHEKWLQALTAKSRAQGAAQSASSRRTAHDEPA